MPVEQEQIVINRRVPNFQRDNGDGVQCELSLIPYLKDTTSEILFHAESVIDFPEDYPEISQTIKDALIAQKALGNNQKQVDLIRVLNDTQWESIEVKCDATPVPSQNLFIECFDTYRDGRVNIAGPARSLAKGNEPEWLHFRDRIKHHNKDAYLYRFDTAVLNEFMLKNDSKFKPFDKHNARHYTTGRLVPEWMLEAQNVYISKTEITIEQYNKYFRK